MAAKNPKSFPADDTLKKLLSEQNGALLTEFKKEGWNHEIVCSGKNSTERFGVLKKSVANSRDGKSETGTKAIFEALERTSATSSATVTPTPVRGKDPADSDSASAGCTSEVRSFDGIPSIAEMRGEPRPALVVALDTEYHTSYGGDGPVRWMLTWQIAFLNPLTGMMELAVLHPVNSKRLSLNDVLGWLIESYGIADVEWCPFDAKGLPFSETRRWEVDVRMKNGCVKKESFKSQAEAIEHTCDEEVREFLSRFEHDRRRCGGDIAGYTNDFSDYKKQALPLVLLTHSGKADLTTFDASPWYEADILPRLKNVQGGLVTIKDVFLHPHPSTRYNRFYPLSVSVRDTMCYAPDGKKSLADLGEAVKVPKIDVPESDKEHMDDFLRREPLRFVNYAVNDSVVTLCYAGSLWGWNNKMPITITSAAAKVAKANIKETFGEDFNSLYRGLKREKKSLVKAVDRPGYIRDTALVPVNHSADAVQRLFTNSYHGGWNGSSEIGWFAVTTHDYDLESAYPTSMCQVLDIDWLSEDTPIEQTWWPGEEIGLGDFTYGPYTPIAGYFEFEFPEDVAYPSIPLNIEGSLVFPLTSKGLDGAYACAPEIYVALKLGAKIKVGKGFAVRARVLTDESGNPSRCLAKVVDQFVRDRALAQGRFGKKSLQDLLLKVGVNGLYGKIAQAVVEKSTWNASKEEMENLGGSDITSPYHAAMITSGVRAVMLAAMNQLTSAGFTCYSVTTDGFITNAPLGDLEGLDLLGLSEGAEAARIELSGNSSIWSEKHRQDGLLNLSTRANVALNAEDAASGELFGVCAHNSYVTEFEKDSREDRVAFATRALSRTGKLPCETKKFSGFKELATKTGEREDFLVETQRRAISMDFDLKRKPVKNSFKTVKPVIEGTEHEIANFSTVPYESVEEYQMYKSIGVGIAKSGCLRTMRDWDVFWYRLAKKAAKSRVGSSDPDFDILVSCVRGHRYHGADWDIPYLGGAGSIADKIDFINKFNTSSRVFKKTDWDNAVRKSREGNILPYELCKDMIERMREGGDAAS